MSWSKKCLADVADFCLGKMLDQHKNKGDFLPYLANVNVRWGEFDFDNLRQMRFEQHEIERYGLKYGDIVMCEGGEPGRCAVWKEQRPGMMIQKAIHRIRPHESLDYRFLYYSFLHKGKNGGFAPLFTGSTIKHLPQQNLARVEVEFPSIPLQERIASILSAYDDLIENNRRRIQLLEQSARLLYKEWFVHLRFPGHEHVAIADGIPEGWEKKTIRQFVTLNYGKSLTADNRIPGIYPVYASSGIVGSHNQSLVKGPGIILGRKGNVGSVFWVDTDYYPIDTVYFISAEQSSFYLYYTLLNTKFISTDVAVPGLNRDLAYSRDILAPTKFLINIFEESVRPVHNQIALLIKQNQALGKARDILLPRLMNGAITV